jgi:uncharacterized Tic20 family protein
MEQTNDSPQDGQVRPEGVQEAKASGELSKDAKNIAMLSHLLGLFTCFVGPLIIWLLKKDDDPFIDCQGKEALNFQITVVIGLFAASVLSFACVGVFLFPVIGVLDLIFCIIASVQASKGQDYRYPISIRLVK